MRKITNTFWQALEHIGSAIGTAAAALYLAALAIGMLAGLMAVSGFFR